MTVWKHGRMFADVLDTLPDGFRKRTQGDPMTGHDFTEFAARLRALASTGHHARQLRRLADDVDATGVVLGLLSPPMIVEPVGSARRSALLDAIVVMYPAKE